MRLLDDERGQSVQVGAAILLGFVVIAVTLYQVQVVSSQNAEVEFNHNQEVREDMTELRNAINNAGMQGTSGSVSVEMGTQYPARSIFLNPPPPRGILRTETIGNVSIENASVSDPEAYTDDVDPSTLLNSTHTTSRISYQPDYAEFDGAGTTFVEHSLAYDRFGNGASNALTPQSVVRDGSITLTIVRGNLSAQGSGSVSVDARTMSGPSDEIGIQEDGGPITLRLPTETPDVWNETSAGSSETNVTGWNPETGRIEVQLSDSTYDLRMAKVGVGNGVESTGRYDVQQESGSDGGNGSGGGAYSLGWEAPDGESANTGAALSGCDANSCTWDVGASSSDILTLNASLQPPFEGVDLQYAVNASSIATLSSTFGATGSDGADTVDLTAQENGTVSVLTSANDGSDIINISVQNVTGGDEGSGDSEPPTFDQLQAQSESNDGNNNDAENIRFTIVASDNEGVDKAEVAITDSDGTNVGQTTFSPPVYSQPIALNPDAAMQGNNYVDIEVVLFDVNGNTRTCTGQINELYDGITIGSGFSCDQTSS